jgi:hypothetical protein
MASWTWAVIRDKLDCTDSFIDRWGKRIVERPAGLFSRHAEQVPPSPILGGTHLGVERELQTQ